MQGPMEPSQTKTALVIKEQYSTAEISITSDLSRYQAMQRRTLALDLTMVAYEMMRKWIDRLFALYSQHQHQASKEFRRLNSLGQTGKPLLAE